MRGILGQVDGRGAGGWKSAIGIVEAGGYRDGSQKKVAGISGELQEDIDIAIAVILERAPVGERERFLRELMAAAGKYAGGD